ncbi:MAG: hypothetical protein LBJ25_03975, partial [Candidatus Margulisbacteria bacterium]|nr:hypothetical protein [Candidatus Margulisiibacteriota bacterium]
EPLYAIKGDTSGAQYISCAVGDRQVMLPAEIGGRPTGELMRSLTDVPLDTISEVQTITVADSSGIVLKHKDEAGQDCYTFLIAAQDNITITAEQIAELTPDKPYIDRDVGTTGLKARLVFANGSLTSVQVLAGSEDFDAAEPPVNYVDDSADGLGTTVLEPASVSK